MSTKHPVHPILIVLPLAAFALTIIALAAHAATGDEAWYRGALFANIGGLAIALIATVLGVADATNLPRFTVARRASLRQVAFSVLGLILFAATATLVLDRYEGHAAGDVVPLTLGAVGFVAIVIASLYGWVVVHALEVGEPIVRYPAHG